MCYILVRLVGNLNSLEGRLEVRYNGIWGTVCADRFTAAAAEVVCYMLGYGYCSRDVDCIYMGVDPGDGEDRSP